MARCKKVRPSIVSCGFCVRSKYHKSYPGSLTKASNVGHLHADVKGMEIVFLDSGARYFVVIVNGYSRFVQAFRMATISEASTKFLEFVKWFERLTGHVVKSFYSDGAREIDKARQTL